MKKIYLAVLEDRHIDHQYEAYSKCKDAIACVKGWMKDYGDRYKWRAKRVQAWSFYAEAGDDCPTVHVEAIELDPEGKDETKDDTPEQFGQEALSRP